MHVPNFNNDIKDIYKNLGTFTSQLLVAGLQIVFICCEKSEPRPRQQSLKMKFLPSLRSPTAETSSETCRCHKLWSTITSFCRKPQARRSLDAQECVLSEREREDLESRVLDWMQHSSSTDASTASTPESNGMIDYVEKRTSLANISNGVEIRLTRTVSIREPNKSKNRRQLRKHLSGIDTRNDSPYIHGEEHTQDDSDLKAFQQGLMVIARHKTI